MKVIKEQKKAGSKRRDAQSARPRKHPRQHRHKFVLVFSNIFPSITFFLSATNHQNILIGCGKDCSRTCGKGNLGEIAVPGEVLIFLIVIT